jgi:hypothetical protein
METEKRIGDFRVNRKVAWSTFFHNRCTPPPSIRKAVFYGILADFVHSIGVDVRTPPPELFQAVLKPGHRHRVLETKPPVCHRLGPVPALHLVEPAVAFDDYLFDLANQAGLPLADRGKVLLGHPLEQAIEVGASDGAQVAGGAGAAVPAASS